MAKFSIAAASSISETTNGQISKPVIKCRLSIVMMSLGFFMATYSVLSSWYSGRTLFRTATSGVIKFAAATLTPISSMDTYRYPVFCAIIRAISSSVQYPNCVRMLPMSALLVF